MGNLLWVLIPLLLMMPAGALSESFSGTGQIDIWHDGEISDRVTGHGTFEYGAEKYTDGFSSGLNISGKGSAKYSFHAKDYLVRLDNFVGQIVAESDASSTTVDGKGSGSIKTRSMEGSRMGFLVAGFPTGGLNANGVWEISTSTTRMIVYDVMEINATDYQNQTALLNTTGEEYV